MDVTERKNAVEALRENEERFRAIFDNAAVGMALTSISGHILKVNQAFCRFLGYSSEELAGMHFSEVTHPQDLDMDTNFYKELTEGVRASYMFDKRYLKKDGEIVWGRLGLSIIRDIDGSPKYGLGTCEDITDRKRALEELKIAKEELEVRVQERTAELSQRAAQLARLTSQLTLAEQMERRRLAEVLHDHLQQFLVAAKIKCEILSENIGKKYQHETKDITALIVQSIRTSRTLTGELSPSILRQGSLSAALEWLAQWMRENYGLPVEFETDPGIDPEREDVTLLLFQSIRELLLNVVKHARAGSARIEMTRDRDDALRVSVIDRGSGFNPETIWEKAKGGAAFGLFSIRERLELMGGSLEIESSPGHGAVLSLVVPLEETKIKDEKHTQKIISQIQKAKTLRYRIRVLIAHYHTVVRQGLSTMLNLHSDIEIVGGAANGQEAVEKARKLRPDVILMDISIPEMGGIEATRIISSEFPNTRIICLSIHDKEDQPERMIEAGASACCTRDGAVDMLLATIRGDK